jgi:hypothetical protein
MGTADFSIEKLGWIKSYRFKLGLVNILDFQRGQLIGDLHFQRETDDEIP